ncbi:hypothetical protein [Labilithrix luteola]|uniref:hypothetical protein n=1 Tax=Labilithrix luteola TaxID=1391654 RepID=UPI0014735B8E|nr:hypothetical protein [Labilithrix luteola]
MTEGASDTAAEPSKVELAEADAEKSAVGEAGSSGDSTSNTKTTSTEPEPTGFRRWMTPESRSRRLLIGVGIWLVCTIVFAIVAGDRMWVHTKDNHFAFLADAWLHGRQALVGSPPAHSAGNDWAQFEGRWYVSFPPFPAMLMLPFVALAGDPDNFRDAQFIVWLAGIGPAVLFLVLEKLRRTARSDRSEIDNIRLALLFAFGTVYFFTAVQGTVWFAAHVVGVALMALFVLCSLDAKRPALAGFLLGCMFLTRVTTVLVAVFFAFEAIRVAYMRPTHGSPRELPSEGDLVDRARLVARNLDYGVLLRIVGTFCVPVLVAIGFASWYNFTRFHDPSPAAFGHEYLKIGWQTRIQQWGLFSYHYLGRNLSAMLAGLPWRPSPKALSSFGGVPFKVNGHGLALWFTTPFYLWLLHPKRKLGWLGTAALVATLGPFIANLLYQNSGWVQFGYRFSNDYAVLLFVLLAIGARKLGRAFWLCAAWALAWNLFGAVTFDRNGAYYAFDNDHVYQPD